MKTANIRERRQPRNGISLTEMPAIARAAMLENLSCNDRINFLLAGKNVGQMDSNVPMLDIRQHLNECHFEMSLTVALWHQAGIGWFVNNRSLTRACKNVKLQVSEGTYDANLSPIDVDAFKLFKSENSHHNFQVKNAKIYDHATGLAFTMSAIRYDNRIYPITHTLTSQSGTMEHFQKVEPDLPIQHDDGTYIKCDILLTGPTFESWYAEEMLSFHPIIPGFGQSVSLSGYYASYNDPF